MHRLKFLLDVNNRLYVHLFFWLAYYFYRVYLYIEIYPSTPLVQFLELPAKIFAVYVNLYLLIPFLLKKRKLVFYSFFLLSIFLLSGIFQTEMVRQMINMDIYNFPKYSLYSGRKFSSVTSTIIGLVGLTTIIKVVKDAYLNQQAYQQLAQERLEAELKFLKSQVNPHFFFNTLNNLYSLIMIDINLAQEIVLKLSSLMSYMLYETNRSLVPLQKEIEYLQNYIELERLRFGDELNITFQFNTNSQDYHIPPLLLLPFIENAFKHSTQGGIQESWINIEGKIKDESLIFEVNNSKAGEVGIEQTLKVGGIGLKNVKRRLELLYSQYFDLTIKKEEEEFYIKLVIPLDLTSSK